MALYIQTNVSSLNAQRQLSIATERLETSYERLSSGYRINSAADDAAGLQITTGMTSQINGLNQGIRNASDGISIAQTAEGALNEYTNILQRMRVLALQSSNGSNGAKEREALDQEFQELSVELTRIAEQTEFNGVAILAQSADINFQVGANASQLVDVTLEHGFQADNSNIALDTADVLTFSAAQLALGTLDGAFDAVNSTRAMLGAKQNRFSSIIRSQMNTVENLSASRSRILDTDFAAETSNLAQTQVLQQSASSMLTQANQQPQIALSLLQG